MTASKSLLSGLHFGFGSASASAKQVFGAREALMTKALGYVSYVTLWLAAAVLLARGVTAVRVLLLSCVSLVGVRWLLLQRPSVLNLKVAKVLEYVFLGTLVVFMSLPLRDLWLG